MADIILRDLADILDNQLLNELRNLTLPGKSKKTIVAYQYDINQYINYCLDNKVPVWSKESLKAFIHFYCEENKQNKVKKALSKQKETPFKFESQGSNNICE